MRLPDDPQLKLPVAASNRRRRLRQTAVIDDVVKEVSTKQISADQAIAILTGAAFWPVTAIIAIA